MYEQFNQSKYNRLNTLAAKASYLLKCEITTREAVRCTTPCFQAVVDSVELPVWAVDEKQTIEQAVLWLKESSLNYQTLSESGI
ncbi:hypothetical protein [Pseudoalteromonas tetraodonis]|uniref:hypothetical protein n=1 Tax=Pseudoalteromonas tetraodonis TaxID=43659 RepID=UPI003002B584